MTIPSPNNSLRPTGWYVTQAPPEDEGFLFINGTSLLAIIVSQATFSQTIAFPGIGNGDTLDLLSVKIPIKVTLTINDTSGGFPGTNTDVDYNMGPSATSQGISLTPDQTVTQIIIRLRF